MQNIYPYFILSISLCGALNAVTYPTQRAPAGSTYQTPSSANTYHNPNAAGSYQNPNAVNTYQNPNATTPYQPTTIPTTQTILPPPPTTPYPTTTPSNPNGVNYGYPNQGMNVGPQTFNDTSGWSKPNYKPVQAPYDAAPYYLAFEDSTRLNAPAPWYDSRPSPDVNSNPSTTPLGQTEPSSKNADLKITQEIRIAIARDNSLSASAKNVFVQTTGGQVILKGTVNNYSERARINTLASSVPGVKAVSNQIVVAGQAQ